MSSGWPEPRIGDVGTIVTGSTPSSKTDGNWGNGAAFLTPSDMPDVAYVVHTERRLSAQRTSDLASRLLPSGAVAVSCITSIGKVARITEPTVTNQQVNSLIPDRSVIDANFAFYWLRTLVPQLHQIASGSVAKIVNKTDFSNLTLPLPDMTEQRRIAGVLGALDDLIEVNRGLVRDLDAAFSVSWQQAAASLSAFTPFGKVAQATKGLSYKGAFLAEEGLPMINMGSFGIDGTHRLAGLKWYVESEVKAKNRLVKGDLVIVNTDLTQSRDILARPIIVPFEHATSTHHTFQVRVPGGEAQRFWLYCVLRQESVRQRLISYATGTTVAALPLDALTSQKIPWAEDSLIDQWWNSAEPLYTSQLVLLDEIQQLSATRDELLPLLMSGRVRVSEEVAA